EPHRLVVEPALEPPAVADDEPLPVLVLLEVVVHPLALHPAGDEVEVALLVLADVLFGGVARAEPEDVVVLAEAAVLEDLREDLRDALVGEDAAVTGPREQPELWDQRGAEQRALVDLVEQLEACEDAVKGKGWAAVVVLDLEPGPGPDHVGEVEILPFG